MDPSTETMLMEAIAAARAGDRVRARSLLTRLLRADSSVVDHWIWLSSVVESRREKIYCLESALKLDPTNRAIMRGLVVLGARAPQDGELAAAPRISRRQIPTTAPVRPTAGRAPLRLNWRWGLVGAALLVGMLGVGWLGYSIFGRPRALSVAPTLPPASPVASLTPELPTATVTPLPASIRALRTPIPPEFAETPIVFFVPQTPTPTPIWGVTPRPQYEAYSAGIAAIARGDFADAADFFNQVIDLDDRLADAHYLRGEALRLQAEVDPASPAVGTLLSESLTSYDRAILLEPALAPAYVGRGRVTLLRTLRLKRPEDLKAEDLPQDFGRAVQVDPLFAPAYVEQADFYRRVALWKTMEEALQSAVDAGVREPLVYVMLSEAQINRAKYDLALENAIEGSASDPTLLDGYLMLGRALVRLELWQEALAPLQTYVVYRGDDHRGWSDLGRAQLGVGDLEIAGASLQRALEVNPRYAPAHLAQGWLHLEQGEYDAGLSSFSDARRYGSENFELFLGFGTSYYHLDRYQLALENARLALTFANQEPDPQLHDLMFSRGYALRALVSEEVPDLVDYAVQNWEWVLGLSFPDPGIRSMAEQHLLQLTGEIPTPAETAAVILTDTPSPTATLGLPVTATQSPSPTLPPTASPTATTVPGPATATPTATTPPAGPTPTPTATSAGPVS